MPRYSSPVPCPMKNLKLFRPIAHIPPAQVAMKNIAITR
jgi:hypothetical protein